MVSNNILILTPGYPSRDNPYSAGFVHQRAMAYLESGHRVSVFVLGASRGSYEFESVPVTQGDVQDLAALDMHGYDRLCIHFLSYRMIRWMRTARIDMPRFVWVHGFEVLAKRRQLFDFEWSVGSLLGFARNFKSRMEYRGFVRDNPDVTFVFVSDWMKRMAERDIHARFPRTRIIPNYVNGNLFAYSPKKAEDRFKVLLVRSFDSRKYANDVAVDAIRCLARHRDFGNYRFTVRGAGRHFEELVARLPRSENVIVSKGLLSQAELAEVYREHGVLLCPTRQDAQGVSMCEGMSLGMAILSSDNTAIPEFVEQGRTGLLSRGPAGLARDLLRLGENPGLFISIGENAAASMRRLCGWDATIGKELELFAAGGNGPVSGSTAHTKTSASIVLEDR